MALKTGVIGLALYAGYAWVNQTPQHAQDFGEKVHYVTEIATEKTEGALGLVEETVDEKSALISEKIDDLGIAEKTADLQQDVKPALQEVRAAP